MNEESLEELRSEYQSYLKEGLRLNMERGWPCKEQLELSMPMLSLVDEKTELCREVDYRSYAGTGGIKPLKKLFADMLKVTEEKIYIGGTMSTTLMYDIVNKAVVFGMEGFKPWKDLSSVKFICPSPGYEKHFKICSTFGIEMLQVPIYENGPDMDMIEKIVEADETVKGIWCVPLYSNPTGAVYSDRVVERLAAMKTKAPDFRIFWDNAYCVHHLTQERINIKNIILECEKSGNPDRVFEFTSTSKITFPSSGVAVCASSIKNIQWLIDNSLLQLKSGDKINQLRHAMFLKDIETIHNHMQKHRALIQPKFQMINRLLHEELDEWGIVKWVNPKGGYFINLELKNNMASGVWKLCKEAGLRITPAGSTFPYGLDKEDKYLRLAPTYLSIKELEKAMKLLCLAMKIVYLEQMKKR